MYLNSNFKMKDLGCAKDCVGMHITYGKHGISLDQTSYINEILRRFNMANCKPAISPSDYNQKLSLSMSPKTSDQLEAV